MITATVSKMGKQRYLNVTNTELEIGDKVSIKPKGIDVKVLKDVVKSGKRKIVIVPKNYFEYFEHGTEVFIAKW